MTAAAIKACGVRRVIGGRAVLDGVDLSVETGEVVVMIGANGAGKSTLLKILSGESAPDDGHVGGPVAEARHPSAMARVRAVVPQSVELAFPFTAFEIVRLGAESGGAGGLSADRLCQAALSDVGLAGYGDRKVSSLSGGEAQRVHLARAIAQVRAMPGPTRFLLLDEPTASLDLCHQLLVVRLARRMAQEGVGVLAILHDINLACLAATRLAALADGQVMANGSPRDIVDDALIERVYGVRLPVGHAPTHLPFVLPQAAG